MNKTRSVKVIKEQERNVPDIMPEDDAAADPNTWSKAVGSWVVEFQQQRRIETLPGFDSLFKAEWEGGDRDQARGATESFRKKEKTPGIFGG